jgi:dephospho-CoA kinase
MRESSRPLSNPDDRAGSVILGLTGSLGSGKSFVSSLLLSCRAKVVCADQLAREVVEPGSVALEEIRSTFGDDVFGHDGSLDRRRLAGIVFSDPLKRKTLESIIHPRVRARELELIAEYAGFPLVVLDVPLLFESEMDRFCDRVAVVVVDDDVREERLLRDRAMTAQEVRERLAAQMPQKEKARRADFLLDNSGTRDETASQVNAMLDNLFPGGLPAPLRHAEMP